MTRRSRRAKQSIGQQVLDLRLEAGITAAHLARAAGIDPAYLSRIEAGTANPTLDVLVATAAQLGSDLSIRLFPGSGPRLHDRFQAPMVEALIRDLHEGWLPTPEVPVHAARGVIDLVLRRRHGAFAIACECHSEIRRLEHVIRRLSEKATALGSLTPWPAEVSSLLLLRSTRETRALARLYEATLGAAFPGRTEDAVAALRGDGPWPGPAVLWASVAAGSAEILDGPPRGVRLGR